MEEEKQEIVDSSNKLQLYLPTRVTKPENWQFIKLVAPKTGTKKKWKTNECMGAYCEKCQVHIVYNPKTGNTKAVQNHMVKFHGKYLIDYKDNKEDGKKKRALIGIEKFARKKQRMEDLLPASQSNQAIADAMLTLWVCKSLRPFAIVEDEGLIDYIHYVVALQRRVKVPSRKSIRKNVMSLSKEVSDRMNKAIEKNIEFYALTSDIWSSRTMQSYMAVTMHAVTKDFDMIDYTLEVMPLTERHTGENIKDCFETIFSSRSLKKEKLVMMLRDNASNGKRACELCDIPSFGCIGHGFHLITGPFLVKKDKDNDESNDGPCDESTDDVADYNSEEIEEITNCFDLSTTKVISELVKIVSSIRKIVKYVKKSTIAKEYFENLQIAQGHKTLQLDLDVRTRWNSTFAMIRKALRLKVEISMFTNHLTTSIGKKEFNRKKLPLITEEEWCLIHGLSIVIEPFHTATVTLSGEKYPTFVFAMPILRVIKKFLMNQDIFTINSNDPDFLLEKDDEIKKFKSAYSEEIFYNDVTKKLKYVQRNLLDQFKERFRGMDIGILWTSVLDPRIRSLKHLTAVERITAKNLFVEEVYELALVKAQEEFPELHTTLEGRNNDNMTKSKLAEIFDSPPKMNNATSSSGVDYRALRCRIEREVDAYMDLTHFVSPSLSPLEWWKRNSPFFPNIYPIARKWLCVPATSTPSERVFSDCGLAGTARRSTLSSDALQHQVTLKRNIDAVGLDVEKIVKLIS